MSIKSGKAMSLAMQASPINVLAILGRQCGMWVRGTQPIGGNEMQAGPINALTINGKHGGTWVTGT